MTTGVKMTHDYTRLFSHTEGAHADAVKDVEDEAKRNADRSARSGKFSGSITTTTTKEGDVYVSRVGSPLVSARVKEKGGYMQGGDRGLLVHLPGGEYRTVEAVRVRAQPAVTPAAARYSEFMARRMRERTGGA